LVRLSAPSSQTLSLWYETHDGSASGLLEYAGTGTLPLSFAPGETAKIVSISLRNDTTAEGTESFYLHLRGPASNGFIGAGTAAATIFDNDLAAGTPVISVSDPIADETSGSATFVISLSQQSTSTVSVKHTTAIGSAIGADFTATSGITAFAPRERAKKVSVPILNDATVEDIETFNLLLSNPINASLPDNRGTARIWGNDQAPVAAPTISADDTTANEGDGTAEFTVRLSAPSNQTVSLWYETHDGSASELSDYAGTATQPLSFAPGETAKVVSISLRNDTTAEGTESFYLHLREPINGFVGTGTATTGTIIDNDGA
jgi:hypothetical protein